MSYAPARLRGALLDIDGTLLDSNDAHAQSWVEIFGRHGYEASFLRVRPLIGKGGDKLVCEMTGLQEETPEAKKMTAERRQLFLSDYLPRCQPTPGAADLVLRLRDSGLRLVVATSSSGEELGALLRQAGVADLIGAATSSDDAANSKPDPDIVQAALAKGGLEPTEAVLLGDTPYDVQAAALAGMGTIAFRCGGWWDDEALSGALAIYDDPAALLEAFDRSLFVLARE